MGKNSEPGPSVCKFLYDDECTPIFQIPSRLVKSYGGELPQTATLRINHSEKCWRVSIEKFKGQYFFTDGWKEFAEEVDMKTREYLLFKAADLSEFHISPDKSDDKELNSGDQTENSEDGDSFTDQENGPHVGKSFTFTAELKSYHKRGLELPKKFTKRARIKKDSKLILQDAEGRQWPVRVTGRSAGSRYNLTAGWLDFLIANKVIVGSLMSFKFVSGSNITIEARVIKEGSNNKALFNSVKRKGNRFEVFEPDKTSDLASGPENLHTMGEHGEGPENYRKTSVHAVGLKEFAEQVDMKTREYLLFKDAGLSEFHVSSEETNGFKELHSGTEEEISKRSGNAKTRNSRMKINPENNDFGVDGSLSFSMELQKWHSYRLDMPRDFTRSTGLDKIGEIQLQDSEGRKWPVYVIDRGGKQGGGKRGGRFSLGKGWHDFVMRNNMVAGSIISFVFISDDTIQVQLVKEGTYELFNFVRTEEGMSENFDLDVKNDRAENFEDEDSDPDGEEVSLVGKRWRFIKKLRRNHVYRFEIPRVFAKDTGIATDRKIKLKDAEGRVWPICVTDKNCGQFHFSGGWHDFLVGNNVVVGSKMFFEFIPNSDNTVEARVVKTGRNEKALFESVKLNCESSKDFGVGNGRRLSFTKAVHKYNAYTLDIPKDFATGSGIAKKNNIKLRDVEGRKWKVCVTERNGQFRVSTGWVDFLKSNNVVIGSMVSFFWSSSDTIDVLIVKEGTDKQALFKHLRKVGGRFELMDPHEVSDLERGHENLNNASDHAQVPADSVLNEKSGNECHSSSEEEMDFVLED